MNAVNLMIFLVLPGVVMFVYLGSLAKSISDIASGGPVLSRAATVALAVASGVVIVAVRLSAFGVVILGFRDRVWVSRFPPEGSIRPPVLGSLRRHSTMLGLVSDRQTIGRR